MEQSERMLALVKEYRHRGITQKEFCLEAGIGLAKLNYWIAKSRETSEPSGFVPLAPIGSKELTLEYPSGVKISVALSDLSLIARLVKL